MNNYLSEHKKEDCCGCMNCLYKCPNDAISKMTDDEGFSYPVIDSRKCIQCSLCEKVCAFENNKLHEIQNIYAIKHSSDEVRMVSSSGGAFTAISDYFLERDYKIYGAVFDENMQVIHVGSREKEIRNRMRGSKYVQSDVMEVFKEIENELKHGEKVMFSGTPCQVNALSLFLGKEYDKLFTLDFVCHGVTSPLFFRDYLQLVSNGSKVKSYEFRDKKEAVWGEYRASIKCEDECNKCYLPYFMNAFSRGFIFRPSCHNCQFTKIERGSDITMSDFWGINSIAAEFGDSKGVSMVCINSDKAKDIFEDIFKDMKVLTVDKNVAISLQAQLHEPGKISLIRKEFWKYYQKHGASKMMQAYCSDTIFSKLRRKPLELFRRYF